MSEQNQAVPAGEKVTDADGNRICTWQDSAQVIAALHKANKRGQYPVTVKFKGEVVSHGTVDMLNLADRERLQAHCRHLDGQINWLLRLVEVAQDLSTLLEGGSRRVLRVTQLSTVTPERVAFWWQPYLPKGRPVALEGDPGVGKSTLVMKLMAHITSGTAFPHVLEGRRPAPPCAPRNVCLLTSEDDPADTLLPRVEVNGGDPSRVFLIDGWRQADGEQGVVTMQELDLLKAALSTYFPALMVFDPLQSFFGRGIDMNSAGDTRPVLDAVAALCQEYGCTPLYVRHIGKTRRDKAIYAGLGSIDITANMRSVLFLGEDPEQKNRRILAHAKSNNAALGQSLAYLITTVERDLFTPAGDMVTVEAPRLDWDGLSQLSASDLTAPPLVDDEDKSALEQAQEFLLELLEAGPVLYDDVIKAMKQAGIALRTLHRAKPLIGVKSRKRPVEGVSSREHPWEWYYPVAH